MGERFCRLGLQERIEIEVRFRRGDTGAEIARALGVHRSTISRELKRGQQFPKEHNYRAVIADQLARKRAAKSRKQLTYLNQVLFSQVMDMLRKGFAPKIISGRLQLLHPENTRMRVCHETIYQWVYSVKELKHRALWQYLPRSHRRRRKYNGRKSRGSKIRYRIPITQRPAEAEARHSLGHWTQLSVTEKLKA